MVPASAKLISSSSAFKTTMAQKKETSIISLSCPVGDVEGKETNTDDAEQGRLQVDVLLRLLGQC